MRDYFMGYSEGPTGQPGQVQAMVVETPDDDVTDVRANDDRQLQVGNVVDLRAWRERRLARIR